MTRFDPDSLRWTDAGLIPAIAQDHQTGEVLMMAWMNRESLAETIRQVEGPDGFDWDIAVDVGDSSGGQAVPDRLGGEHHVGGELRRLPVADQDRRQPDYASPRWPSSSFDVDVRRPN
mgnify:CR=1 FL=1